MNKYIIYFGYFGYLALMAYIHSYIKRMVTRQENIQGKTVTRYNWLFALLAAAPLIYLAAIRGRIGDTGMYMRSFKNAPTSFSGIPSYVAGLKKDRGFYIFAAIMRTLLGYRPVVYFGIIASFQIVSTSHKYEKTGQKIWRVFAECFSHTQNLK